MTTLLLAALAYAERGWPVFPLHSPVANGCSCGEPECDKIGKHPRTRNGVKDATTELAQVDRWWTRWPYANIGIATGAASGIWVLDVDGAEGESSLAVLVGKHGALHDTPVSRTGRGRQFYFTHASGLRNRVAVAPGLDIRTDGGYVVAPPSLHANGRTYQWMIRPLGLK